MANGSARVTESQPSWPWALRRGRVGRKIDGTNFSGYGLTVLNPYHRIPMKTSSLFPVALLAAVFAGSAAFAQDNPPAPAAAAPAPKAPAAVSLTELPTANHLVHKVNGQVTSIFTDHDEKGRALEGLLAIQLHAGNPHQVQIKDLRLKVLDDAKLVTFDPAALPAGAKKIAKPTTTRPQGNGPATPVKK